MEFGIKEQDRELLRNLAKVFSALGKDLKDSFDKNGKNINKNLSELNRNIMELNDILRKITEIKREKT